MIVGTCLDTQDCAKRDIMFVCQCAFLAECVFDKERDAGVFSF